MNINSIGFVSENVEKETYLPAQEKIVAGTPTQGLWNNYSSDDSKFHVGIWESQSGKWTIRYSEHEFCHILEGSSVISDKEGNRLEVNAGDQFVIPAGFEGTWEVANYCKKTYVIYEA